MSISTLVNSCVEELTEEFERHPEGRGIAKILGRYAEPVETWEPFFHFDDEAYTRNLIHRNEWFELLVLCWERNQESPIHNHAGQNCWMAILEGGIEEVQFEPRAEGSTPGPLDVKDRRTYDEGEVGFIRDDLALHLIRPQEGNRGVSLHLYSRPIDACNIYCPETGRVTEKTLSYYSIGGVPTASNLS